MTQITKVGPTSICKHCGRTYDRKALKKVLGADSLPVLLGYCGAFCYTDAKIDAKKKLAQQ
jgi:hypothetical protein